MPKNKVHDVANSEPLTEVVARLDDDERGHFLRGLRTMKAIYLLPERADRVQAMAAFRADRDAWDALCRVMGPLVYRRARGGVPA